MKWQIGGGGWPVGPILIPAGTIVSGEAPTWNGIALPLPMPIDAVALDREAAAMMRRWYPAEHHHRLMFGPDVKET